MKCGDLISSCCPCNPHGKTENEERRKKKNEEGDLYLEFRNNWFLNFYVRYGIVYYLVVIMFLLLVMFCLCFKVMAKF